MMTTNSGGESNPLMTAIHKRAFIGLIPRKSTDMPTSVEILL